MTDEVRRGAVLTPQASARLDEAVSLFARGEYHACHDVLEGLWREDGSPVRDIYKGVLQVGVAYWHAGRGNLRGALRLAVRGVEHLVPFMPSAFGLDLATLVEDVRHASRLWEEAAMRGDSAPDVPSPRLVRATSPRPEE